MNICIAHFRIGLTDGVSLEIEKRIALLKEMGHHVYTIGDQQSVGADLTIPYFDYKRQSEVLETHNQAFGDMDELSTSHDLVEAIAQEIEIILEQFWTKHKFEVLFVHNIFSLPVCLPATVAFYSFIKRHKDVRAIAVHHDFYWEPARIASFSPKDHYGIALLYTFFPPVLPTLSHCVISKYAQTRLMAERSIPSTVITDTFDFNHEPWKETEDNKSFLPDLKLKDSDVVFLIATRIRRRKAVEIGIQFMEEIQKMKKHLIGKKKHNGSVITKESNFVLLLPGEYGDKELGYVNLLQKEAKEAGVELKWIQNIVGSDLEKQAGLKRYTLWDCYIYSDVVVYPTVWEGWGNQFIEAVFAKKPVVAFEYEVFKTDIGPVGFKVVSLGDQYTKLPDSLVSIPPSKAFDAAKQICDVITNKDMYNEMTRHNFNLGKRTHNTNIQLRNHLKTIIG